MDPRKRKRVPTAGHLQSMTTRSKSGASALLQKAEMTLNFAKRKPNSPSKIMNEKSVFRDLTNREVETEPLILKIHDDKVVAAVKKPTKPKISEHNSRKTVQLKAISNLPPAKQNEGTLTSYFRITKTAKIGQNDKQKIKNVDPGVKQADIQDTKIVSAAAANKQTTCVADLQITSQNTKGNVKDQQNCEDRCTFQCARDNTSSLATNPQIEGFSDDLELDPTVPPVRELPLGVSDFDAENWSDPFQVSNYATDIFNYFKSIESQFQIKDYMCSQRDITTGMRAVVIDWMVELQETFELNHETLYLAVKLLDSYLSKVSVKRDLIQLVAVAALFVAAKYDERFPPSIEDHLYVCEKAYTENQLKAMEISILKIMDFNLGFPISYRFLRRYARFGRVPMPILTLARYILEYSLLDYSFISESDSKLAAAAMLLALKMKDKPCWTPDLQYASGYVVEDLKETAQRLNTMLHKVGMADSKFVSVKNKYSHRIFFEVAKLPLLQKLKFH